MDVKVPVENRIGNEGDGMKAAQTWINADRVAQAARGLGLAQRCLEMITSYAKQRSTFGRTLDTRQAVQFAVADLYTKLQAGQLLTYRTAWKFDNGTLARHDTFMTKSFALSLVLRRPTAACSSTAVLAPPPKCQSSGCGVSRSFMITGGPVEIMRASLTPTYSQSTNDRQGGFVQVRATLLISAVVGFVIVVGGAAQAQDQYPSRAIKIIVPTSPGAVTDIMARSMGQALSQAWGQPVIVDNRPGGDELLGGEAAAKSSPDGYRCC